MKLIPEPRPKFPALDIKILMINKDGNIGAQCT